MSAPKTSPPRRLLLVEPDSLMRSTIASVARTLDLADLREASTLEGAEALLRAYAFEGLLVAIGDDGDGLPLLERLRAGSFETPSKCPLVVLVGRCDEARVEALRALAAQRVILKPFKVKTVLEGVAQLARSAKQAEHVEA